MQKHVVKALIITALGIAVPAMGFTIAKIAQSQFKDVPAGHWAQQAVDYVNAKGLITGFPDGTFRGKENVSRYQAAQIFYRLLQSGAMNQVDPNGQAVINKGMAEVQSELEALRNRVAALESANKNQDSRLGTLEDQLKNLSGQPTISGGTNLEPRVKALEDLLAALNAKLDAQQTVGVVDPGLQAKVSDLESQLATLRANLGTSTPDTQQSARIAAIESDIAALKTQVGTAQPNPVQAAQLALLESKLSDLQTQVNGMSNNTGNTELAGRVAALETQIKALSVPVVTADLSPQVTALENRITSLENKPSIPDSTAQVTQLQSDLRLLQDRVSGIASANPATAAADQNVRLGALETQLQTLSSRVDAIKPSGTDPALAAQIKAQEAKIADLQVQINAKPGGADPAIIEQLKTQSAQLAALEAKVDALKPGGTDPALAAQIKAQDAKIADLQAQVASYPSIKDTAILEQLKAQDLVIKAQDTKINAQETRISDLEGQVDDLNASITELSDAVARIEARPTTPVVTTTPTTPVVTTTPTTPVVTTPTTSTSASSSYDPNFYVGVGARFTVLPSGGAFSDTTAISGMFGWKRFIGPIGLRVTGDYYAFASLPSAKYFSVNPALMLDLGFLYFGVGAGGEFGLQNSLFVNGIVGFNIAFSDSFGLFVEGDPRFYLNQPTDQFRFGIRTGLKFRF